MINNPKLNEALERFDALLKQPKTKELQWQKLFTDCPYILSRSLPLRVEDRQIQALGRPGKREPDFIIHPEPTQWGSPRGIIELKPPHSRVLTFPRKDQVILSRSAATAIHQLHVYAKMPLWPNRVIVIGSDLYLFVIMGLAKNWADIIQSEVFQHQIEGQTRGIRLFGYDQIFDNYRSSLPQQLILLVPARNADDNEVVCRLLHEKLRAQKVSAEDIEYIMKRKDYVKEALENFQKYGDFSVSWVPGDGDGYGDRIDSIGGLVIGMLFVYPP